MLGFKLFTQSIEKVVFENTYQDHFERSGPRPEWKLGPRLSLRFETYNRKVTLVCEHDKTGKVTKTKTEFIYVQDMPLFVDWLLYGR